MPEYTDEQLAAIRKEAADAARADADKRASEADNARQQMEQRYRNDMQRAEQILQSLSQPQQPAATPDDDPDAIVDNKKLKQALDAMNANVAQHLTNTQIEEARDRRKANRKLAEADPRLKHLKNPRYAAEVEATLDLLDPRWAAKPTAYEEAYGIVIGRHVDEIEKLAADEARKAREAEDDDEYAGEPTRAAPASAAPASTREAPVPASDASGARRSQRRAPQLDEHDQRIAERHYGGDTAAYMADKQKQSDVHPMQYAVDRDPFGSKGKDRF